MIKSMQENKCHPKTVYRKYLFKKKSNDDNYTSGFCVWIDRETKKRTYTTTDQSGFSAYKREYIIIGTTPKELRKFIHSTKNQQYDIMMQAQKKEMLFYT